MKVRRHGHRYVETFNNIYRYIRETSEIVNDMINNVKTVDEVANSLAAITEEQSASTRKSSYNKFSCSCKSGI